MAYKVLYRKYRPNDLDNVVGQEYTISMLKNSIINGKNSHAYIFTGPRGTGKTSTAKIFAKAINCEHPVNGNPCNECKSCLSFNESPDIIEIDAASNNGVDEIRELINNVKLVPSSLKYKVYIIDEVHMLTASAFNALLLTLEEPPSHVVFILATTDIQDVPITILSRCQRFDFKPVNLTAIIERLRYISNIEKIDIDDDALKEIALISAGGMRDALGMLDQLASLGNKITLNEVSSNFGSVSVEKIDEILDSILGNNVEKMISLVENVRNSGTNYSVFVEKLILELRKCAIDIKLGKAKYDFYFEDIYQMIIDLNDSLCNININVDPYVLIELVLLKYTSSSDCKKENIILPSSGNNNIIVKSSLNNPRNTVSTINESNTNIESNKLDKNSEEIQVINKPNYFSAEIRINNCFVSASKIAKMDVTSSWVDFMNYLMLKDRNLVSLLADTIVLAASDKYILIQSKVDTTNSLINDHINALEKFYEEYSSKNMKFAAVNNEIWKKEVEKYRLNRNNQIKYKYMDESEDSKEQENIQQTSTSSDIEDVAREIFDSFEVE